MEALEFLVGYGRSGDFGRFRAAAPLDCRRGDRVVVRSCRGVELGSVLREATPRHAAFLPNTTVGQLLRRCTPDDEATLGRLRPRGQGLFERARALADELGLPLAVIDAELLLDGVHAVLHHLRFADCDVRPFVSTLAREFDLHIQLADLTRAAVAEEEHADHGCGSCGSGGGCGSCGSGGGGCGSCGSAKPEEDTQARFSALRDKMEAQRVPLL